MATIAEFTVPTRSFALAEALPEFPGVIVETDRIAAHGPDTTMPCLWAADRNAPGFADAVAEDPTVETLRATAEFDHECLYHVEWSDEIDRLVEEMIDREGVVLEAQGRDDRWWLRIRFMTRDQFEIFRDRFDDRGPEFQLEQLFTAKHPRHTQGDVTPEQREAMLTATELGYYRVPREASIEDVGDELGVSHQAVSERLRRGTENLVRDMLRLEPIRERG